MTYPYFDLDDNLDYPTLYDLRLKVEGQTVPSTPGGSAEIQTRYLNPAESPLPAQSSTRVPTGYAAKVAGASGDDFWKPPRGAGASSAVFTVEEFGTIMPGGYGPATFIIPDDEIWANPLVYVEMAKLTLYIASGDYKGEVVWQGWMKEPVRSANGATSVEGHGWWERLQENFTPFLWQTGDSGDDWTDVESAPYRGWKNANSIDLAVKKASVTWKVVAGTRLTGGGLNKTTTDASRAGCFGGPDEDQGLVLRVAGTRHQNRDMSKMHLVLEKQQTGGAIGGAGNYDPAYNTYAGALADTKEVANINISSKTSEGGSDFSKLVTNSKGTLSPAHSVTLCLYASVSHTPGSEFRLRIENLRANGNAYRSIRSFSPGVSHVQWELRSADQMVMDISWRLGITATKYGDHQSDNTYDHASYWQYIDQTDDPDAPGYDPTGYKDYDPPHIMGLLPADHDSDEIDSNGNLWVGKLSEEDRRQYPYRAVPVGEYRGGGMVARRLRDGNFTFSCLPLWWSAQDGSVWDLLTHLAHKYNFKVALWDLDNEGFEFSSSDNYWAPWTKMWNVYAYGANAMCTAELEPASDIYTQVVVTYKLRHSKRHFQVIRKVLPDPYAGLPASLDGFKKRTKHFHIKERQNDSRLAERYAKWLARQLSGVRLSGSVGPLSYVYDDYSNTHPGEGHRPLTTKYPAMLVRAGDKVRILDFPAGVTHDAFGSYGTLAAAINSSTTTVTVTETHTPPDGAGEGQSSNPVPSLPFVIQIDDEQMKVTNRTGPVAGVYTYTVVREWNSTPQPIPQGSCAVGPFDVAGPAAAHLKDATVWSTNLSIEETGSHGSAGPHGGPEWYVTIDSETIAVQAAFNIQTRHAPSHLGGPTWYTQVIRNRQGTTAAVHDATSQVYMQRQLHITETRTDLNSGVMLISARGPVKVHRWGMHYQNYHREAHEHR